MRLTNDLKRRATSKAAWVLPKESSAIAPEDVWTNKDLDPSPAEFRTWTSWTFFTYWVADLISPGGWATVASFVSLGLTWWESVIATFLGAFLVAIVITANGYIGATVHTPFAITARSVFGYYGSRFAIFSRMVIACFWLSINTYQGGGFVTQMITAIWPQYRNLPNTLSASSGLTSSGFLSFFLFWLMQLPFMFIHPSKLGWLFTTKAIVTPIVSLGTLIWAVKIAGSGASLALSTPALRAAPGAPRFIAFMYATTSVMGTWATLSCNIGDFSRYCKKPSAAYVQLLAIPLLLGGISIFGAVSAACTYAVYGVDLYQPYDMISKWQVSPGGRAAAFLGSFAWALANLTTNITANSISAANDMTALAPKWINIRRGQVIALTIGVYGFAPWKVLDTAANFLTFMASYSIVLAPIAALLAVDFFIVKNRKLDIYELYRPRGIYYFSKGWNWRACVALVVAIVPNLPGMINAINPSIKIGNARYIYMVSNLVGDAIACGLYVALSKIFPPTQSLVDQAVHDVIPEESSTERAWVEAKDHENDIYTAVQPVGGLEK